MLMQPIRRATVKTINCQIFSDIICPWCLIGWTHLKNAKEQLNGSIDLNVQWLPYQLNPGMPADGMDRQDYLSSKFGGEARAREIYGRIEQAAESAGITVSFDKIGRTPNTMAAHRLIMLAEKNDCATPLKEALFDLYFKEGADIGDAEVLVSAAESVGLPAADAKAFLDGDEGTDTVQGWQVEAGRLGISGVPFFIINEKYGLSGAQPPDVFARALTDISEGAA